MEWTDEPQGLLSGLKAARPQTGQSEFQDTVRLEVWPYTAIIIIIIMIYLFKTKKKLALQYCAGKMFQLTVESLKK